MKQTPVLMHSDYYQPLLYPVSQENPCGEQLDYDPAFIMLQSRLQPKLGAEYGNFVEAAEPINWTETERDCLSLLQKSRDVRLVIILMRCRLRKVGLPAITEGAEALHALLSAWPDDLHPQLLDEGEFAPMLRANAFAELEDIEGFLTDLRNQLLPKAAGLQISIKEFEKAHMVSREPETLSEAAVAALVHEWHFNAREILLPLSQAYTFIQQIKQILITTLGDEAPELITLLNILALFHKEFGDADMAPAGHIEPPASITAAEAPAPAEAIEEVKDEAIFHVPTPLPVITEARRSISNRAEALHRLQEIRSWFGMTEPSSPLVPLLKYAEESIGKNFSDLLKMYPPEIVAILSQEKE